MKRSKFFFFVGIVVSFLVILFYPKLTYWNSQDKKVEETEMKEIQLREGEYMVGQDIAPGTYDFLVTEGEISLFGQRMSEGSKLVGTELLAKNWFPIEGKGSVKIDPAKFNKIIPKENVYTVEHSGRYKIGVQLHAGEYLVRYKTDEPMLEQLPEIQTTNAKANIITFATEVRDTEQLIELVEGEILYVTLHQPKPDTVKLLFVKNE